MDELSVSAPLGARPAEDRPGRPLRRPRKTAEDRPPARPPSSPPDPPPAGEGTLDILT